MNKCDNPVYQKVTRRGKVCDICMKRSKGVQQECQTCTMTTCRKCYNERNFDQYHDLSLAEGLDWTNIINPADEVEPRRGPIVRHIESDGSLSSQPRAKAVVAPKPHNYPNRGNHPDAHKKEYGHKELYSKSKQNASAPEDPKRKNQSTDEQQPAKKKPKRQDYQLYQTTSKRADNERNGDHRAGEQHANNERIGDQRTGDQHASSAHGTGFDHQAGHPPLGPQYPPGRQTMVYDPRTGHYYPHQRHGFGYGHHGMGIPHPQQQRNVDYGHQGMGQFYPEEQQGFAHDGRLPSLRPLPTQPLAHPRDDFRAPEHAQAAQMPFQRDYYGQQAYHHQMGFQHPSEPQNMLHSPQMGSYHPQYPQHLGFDIPQTGYGHPQAGYHGPQQPRALTPHDPRMTGLREARDQQSGRHTAVPQPQEDLGIPEPQQRRGSERENSALLPGTPHGSTPESMVPYMRAPLQDTDDDFPPARARQQQRQSARTQSDQNSLSVPKAAPEYQAMNMRMPLQDTDDDFPPSRQQRQSARTQSDEGSLFVPEAVPKHQAMNMRMPLRDTDDDFPPLRSRQQRNPAKIQSDEGSLFVPEAVLKPHAPNTRMPLQDTDDDFPPSLKSRQQRKGAKTQSDEDSLFVPEAESVSQSDRDSLYGQAYEDADEVSVVGGPEAVQQRAAEQQLDANQGGEQLSKQERENLIARLVSAWAYTPEINRIRNDQDFLSGALAAIEELRGSVMLGAFGPGDATKAIACAWLDSLRKTYLGYARRS
ncbi:hypothetical protein BJ166DRAFT_604980 [Pestalotiopsis sp. NC0098]|nr:hypothetical protein BJ166DRAFT_604980 [Pestalotiopsis sp. NC0098]